MTTSNQVLGNKLGEFSSAWRLELEERLTKLLGAPAKIEAGAVAPGDDGGEGVLVTGSLASGDARVRAVVFVPTATAHALAAALRGTPADRTEEIVAAFPPLAGELIEAAANSLPGGGSGGRVEDVKWASSADPGQGVERAILTMTFGEVSGALWIDLAAAQPAALERPPESLLELELPFALRLASVEMELAKLQELDTGALIPLGRSADGDINLVVGGRVIARGQLVVVDGCFGIQIDSVETTERRLKTLGRV